ncbi:hypothetical protein FNF29_01945 [Cafeteria roenbergensis]|uniref:Uncharacterized protein n=1 Tax=Cafeteria roenbergensis TaxID=33653 RepID=A0A5A8CRV5_CAFRO|nr:hypothetical protein FNF29_01945 [Cafeteria roenbergensis]|eukprot:KAA0155194.1 hypothetical protein FNF29_01945 [Cafeteria roenbergensis]
MTPVALAQAWRTVAMGRAGVTALCLPRGAESSSLAGPWLGARASAMAVLDAALRGGGFIDDPVSSAFLVSSVARQLKRVHEADGAGRWTGTMQGEDGLPLGALRDAHADEAEGASRGRSGKGTKDSARKGRHANTRETHVPIVCRGAAPLLPNRWQASAAPAATAAGGGGLGGAGGSHQAPAWQDSAAARGAMKRERAEAEAMERQADASAGSGLSDAAAAGLAWSGLHAARKGSAGGRLEDEVAVLGAGIAMPATAAEGGPGRITALSRTDTASLAVALLHAVDAVAAAIPQPAVGSGQGAEPDEGLGAGGGVGPADPSGAPSLERAGAADAFAAEEDADDDATALAAALLTMQAAEAGATRAPSNAQGREDVARLRHRAAALLTRVSSREAGDPATGRGLPAGLMAPERMVWRSRKLTRAGQDAALASDEAAAAATPLSPEHRQHAAMSLVSTLASVADSVECRNAALARRCLAVLAPEMPTINAHFAATAAWAAGRLRARSSGFLHGLVGRWHPTIGSVASGGVADDVAHILAATQAPAGQASVRQARGGSVASRAGAASNAAAVADADALALARSLGAERLTAAVRSCSAVVNYMGREGVEAAAASGQSDAGLESLAVTTLQTQLRAAAAAIRALVKAAGPDAASGPRRRAQPEAASSSSSGSGHRGRGDGAPAAARPSPSSRALADAARSAVTVVWTLSDVGVLSAVQQEAESLLRAVPPSAWEPAQLGVLLRACARAPMRQFLPAMAPLMLELGGLPQLGAGRSGWGDDDTAAAGLGGQPRQLPPWFHDSELGAEAGPALQAMGLDAEAAFAAALDTASSGMYGMDGSMGAPMWEEVAAVSEDSDAGHGAADSGDAPPAGLAQSQAAWEGDAWEASAPAGLLVGQGEAGVRAPLAVAGTGALLEQAPHLAAARRLLQVVAPAAQRSGPHVARMARAAVAAGDALEQHSSRLHASHLKAALGALAHAPVRAEWALRTGLRGLSGIADEVEASEEGRVAHGNAIGVALHGLAAAGPGRVSDHDVIRATIRMVRALLAGGLSRPASMDLRALQNVLWAGGMAALLREADTLPWSGLAPSLNAPLAAALAGYDSAAQASDMSSAPAAAAEPASASATASEGGSSARWLEAALQTEADDEAALAAVAAPAAGAAVPRRGPVRVSALLSDAALAVVGTLAYEAEAGSATHPALRHPAAARRLVSALMLARRAVGEGEWAGVVTEDDGARLRFSVAQARATAAHLAACGARDATAAGEGADPLQPAAGGRRTGGSHGGPVLEGSRSEFDEDADALGLDWAEATDAAADGAAWEGGSAASKVLQDTSPAWHDLVEADSDGGHQSAPAGLVRGPVGPAWSLDDDFDDDALWAADTLAAELQAAAEAGASAGGAGSTPFAGVLSSANAPLSVDLGWDEPRLALMLDTPARYAPPEPSLVAAALPGLAALPGYLGIGPVAGAEDATGRGRAAGSSGEDEAVARMAVLRAAGKALVTPLRGFDSSPWTDDGVGLGGEATEAARLAALPMGPDSWAGCQERSSARGSVPLLVQEWPDPVEARRRLVEALSAPEASILRLRAPAVAHHRMLEGAHWAVGRVPWFLWTHALLGEGATWADAWAARTSQGDAAMEEAAAAAGGGVLGMAAALVERLESPEHGRAAAQRAGGLLADVAVHAMLAGAGLRLRARRKQRNRERQGVIGCSAG